jgi:hypothetical protein
MKYALLVLLALVLTACGRGDTGSAGGAGGGGGGPVPGPGVVAPGGPPVSPVAALRSPQTLVDEDAAIEAHSFHAWTFSLSAAAPVQLTTEGKKNVDKGFDVHVMSKADCDTYAAGYRSKPRPTVQPIAAFEGLQVVTSVPHTGTLAAGNWCAVVENAENLVNGMIVHVRVVVDPR